MRDSCDVLHNDGCGSLVSIDKVATIIGCVPMMTYNIPNIVVMLLIDDGITHVLRSYVTGCSVMAWVSI